MDEKVFDFVNEDQHAEGYTNILLWLEGRVAGLRIENRDGVYVPIIRNAQVGIYVDEMPVDPQFINGYSVSEIAMVKVIKGYFVGGFGGGGGGAIAIYTRKGGMGTAANKGSILNNDQLAGYSKLKDYPFTNYQESYYRVIRKDTREVLLWKPMATSSDDKFKIMMEFYNNDVAKQFRVIILGITPEGQPVYFNSIISK
jgi:hypothetical protein